MIRKLDLDYDGEKPLVVGSLTQEIINDLGLNITPKDIIIWKDRIGYIEKHKSDFENEESYKRQVEKLPEIIQNPDYYGIHPSGDSIEFIKIIDNIMLVACRVKTKGSLVVRSCYPISKVKLDNYVKSGRTKKANQQT